MNPNRLMELEKSMGKPMAHPGRKPARSASLSSYLKPVPGKRTGRSRRTRSFSAVDYSITGAVPVIAQIKTNGCWATVYTMIESWRRGLSISIEDALDDVGAEWRNIYDANTGLFSDDKNRFISDTGLVAEPPQSYTTEGYEMLLRNYGPVWVTTAGGNDTQIWSVHARIITGIHGDGTAAGTKFDIIDPSGGREYQLSLQDFYADYEREAAQGRPLRVQVLHWHADAQEAANSSTAENQSTTKSLRAYGLAANQTGSVEDLIQQLIAQGISETEIRDYVRQQDPENIIRAFSAMPRSLGADGITVHLPGTTILEGWQVQIAIRLLQNIPGPMGLFFAAIPLILDACDRFNVTVGVGPAIAGGLYEGAGLGAGVVFAPGQRVGFYGSGSYMQGLLDSAAVALQVTVIHGGPSVFSGQSVAASVTIDMSEGIGIGGHALFNLSGQFIGVTGEVSFSLGVPGISAIEAFATFQTTATTFGLRQSRAQSTVRGRRPARVAKAYTEEIALTPANGGISIGEDSLQIGDILLSTGNSAVSTGIRTATGSPVSHSALYIGDGQVVEAIGSGVTLQTLEQALADDSVSVAFRYPGLSENEALMIRDFAGQNLGANYNYYGIVKQARFTVNSRICNLIPNERLKEQCRRGMATIHMGTPSNRTFFCSQLIVEAYARAGVPLTSDQANWVTPGDLAQMREDQVPQLRFNAALEYVGHLKA